MERSKKAKLPDLNEGYSINDANDGCGYIVSPDDVLWLDLDIIGNCMEAAGWSRQEKDSAAHTFRQVTGEGNLKLYDTGQLKIEGLARDVAERIAQEFVNSWLLIDDP